MSKSALFVATIFASVFGAAAYGQSAPATPDVVMPPAQQAAPAVNQVGCQPVKFTRPDVTPEKNVFMITLHLGDDQAIKACNPGVDVHETPNGVGVVITYGADGAVINLPPTLKNDSASNGRCVNDANGNVADAVVYKGDWADGLPDHVDLQKLDPAFFDKKARLNDCERLNAERKLR
ncbi:MAG: hypothetical protein P4L81_03190 [Candidatus Pacebacteria bacterium]|nr:hypothetical protein [Candidatus Paceibacterota bacterium]